MLCAEITGLQRMSFASINPQLREGMNSLAEQKIKPKPLRIEKCGICSAENPNGGTRCPALHGELVCYAHCLKCEHKETETSLSRCLYQQRILIFALPQEVAHWTAEHKEKDTEWLKNTYDVLMKGYKKTPDRRFTRRAELAAIRGILFHRQFADSFK